jgi:Endonuclease/Exonuclease/phosphatase family
MSYNIFQGSELSHSLEAQTLSQLGPAVAADYENVIRSNIPARARALAAEIASHRPAVVGLQEAVLWRTAPAGTAPVAIPGTATHASYDFVKLLVRALAARGMHYRAPAIINNLDIQATGDFPNGKKMDVRYTDRVAILVRRGVSISNVQDHNYVTHDAVKVVGVPLPVPDGWASVDAKVGGRQFRFITTHLDGLNDSQASTIRAAEAAEILNGPAKTSLPVIFTCDCNSTPGTQTYSELTAAGLQDNWARIHHGLAGLTCCHRSSPTDPETDVADPHRNQGIVERLDYIFSRSPFATSGITRLGTNPADRTRTKPRLWPSDHFGLVAELLLR